ncbi:MULTISPECIES: isochorismatase family protein [Psychrobacter]|uniref:Hydrolase n=3 Tax=Psychrobacter TaxID=497 RepID=A0A1G6YJE3_9GAMM|nr:MULTISPECIES: isochorismatase family protein [Psychrobacter]HBD03310.1 hydrolase [Psychrobacter sp.]AOY44522.1 phenazine biosynthesis protein [Psychrobacter sp. AntiMn-1]KRU22095.1 hydrolase [Psychrobacter piscatorii]MDE0842831.1 isochorismatase family protein [Psychrobacter pacificensis]MDH4905804.1 hydrolase [Psychrobacter pocilloporae]
MSTMITDRTYRIARENTQAMIIDVQERLTPYIYDHENIVKKTVTIIKGLQALGIPIMLNEQYKKGLGDSLPELRDVLEGDNAKSFEKVTFSACDNNDTWHHLAQQNRSTVLLIGVEAHVCVLQTALDLLDNGMQPVIIGDAVGSRFPYDKKQAIRRIRRAGGIISTVETILFELCRSSEDPAFKTILNLIK